MQKWTELCPALSCSLACSVQPISLERCCKNGCPAQHRASEMGWTALSSPFLTALEQLKPKSGLSQIYFLKFRVFSCAWICTICLNTVGSIFSVFVYDRFPDQQASQPASTQQLASSSEPPASKPASKPVQPNSQPASHQPASQLASGQYHPVSQLASKQPSQKQFPKVIPKAIPKVPSQIFAIPKFLSQIFIRLRHPKKNIPKKIAHAISQNSYPKLFSTKHIPK